MSNETNKTDKNLKIKKYAIFAVMFLIFGAVMWFIYAPSKSDKEKKESKTGFNANIPAPKNDVIVADKKAAYEQEQMRQRQEEKMKSLQDYSFILDEAKEAKSNVNENEAASITLKNGSASFKSSSNKKSSAGNSTDAYRDINKTLGSFYEKPKEDEEKKEMQEKIEKLEALLGEKNDKPVDPLYLMEKSYELAAKYAPQNDRPVPNNQREEHDGKDGNANKNPSRKGKASVSHVSQVREQIVSGLVQPMSDAEFMRQMSVSRNIDFYSLDDDADHTAKNTVSACIHDDQVLIDGLGNDEARKTARLRLAESMRVDDLIIPANTVITGKVNFQGERLGINVSSIEFEGRIIPVDMNAYDLDGQYGIYVPGSMDINAVKEIVANMGANMGSSINISQQSAGDQLLADLGRGAIQGTSQYASKKIRLKKVTLKSGYKLFLLPSDNQ